MIASIPPTVAPTDRSPVTAHAIANVAVVAVILQVTVLASATLRLISAES